MRERYLDHSQKEVRGIHSDLTTGSIIGTTLRFALPMITGNLLRQFYDIADALIVGRYLGAQALAAVGAAYALIPFLTFILLGLYIGSGTAFSLRYGEKNEGVLKPSMFVSFILAAVVALILDTAVFLFIDPIMYLLCIPVETYGFMREYLWIISFGISAVSLYNYFACPLRAVGNSFVPLMSLGASALLNAGLDLVFVLVSKWGVTGVGAAAAVSQFVSGIGICLYTYLKMPEFRINRSYMRMDREALAEISGLSFLACIQQSVIDLDILMVQGLVSSLGAVVMAASAAVMKIGSFTYIPVQDFGGAFSTLIAQNYEAGRYDWVEKGIKGTVTASILFCLAILFITYVFARELMFAFVQSREAEVLAVGVQYFWIEGTFYYGIGCLFLLYGLYHAVGKPEISVVLTIISLGIRAVPAYILSAILDIGVAGIWVPVPIGQFLVNCAGFTYCWMKCRAILGQGGSRGE